MAQSRNQASFEWASFEVVRLSMPGLFIEPPVTPLTFRLYVNRRLLGLRKGNASHDIRIDKLEIMVPWVTVRLES